MKIKIKTDSINANVYGHYYHPDVEEGIEEEELLSIRKITISSHNELNKDDIYRVDLQELKLLKNLSFLTIEDIEIDLNDLNNILTLPKLTELCFHGIEFKMKSEMKFELKDIRTLIFSECKNTNNLSASNIFCLKLIGDNTLLKLENIKILDLSLYKFKSNMFDIKNIDTINVSKNLEGENIVFLSNKCKNLQKESSSDDIFKLYTLFNNIYDNFTIDDDNISQEEFEELVNIAQKFKYPFEALFRIALNYSDTSVNFDTIESYIIDKLNAAYLLELYSVAGENQLNDIETKNKLSQVKDKGFLLELVKATWLLDSELIIYLNETLKKIN